MLSAVDRGGCRQRPFCERAVSFVQGGPITQRFFSCRIRLRLMGVARVLKETIGRCDDVLYL